MKLNNILIVMEKNDLQNFAQLITDGLNEYPVKIITADNAIDGLLKYKQYSPCLVIADAQMYMLNGLSMSAIIKGMMNEEKCTVYVVGDFNCIPVNAYADSYLPRSLQKATLIMQIKDFLDQREMRMHHSDEIIRAKMRQAEFLPLKVNAHNFSVDYIYSPFSDLSGDCLDYWYGENENGLYGFLFDCTGHDLCSFLQVGEVRTLLRSGCKMYQKNIYKSLSAIMENTNEESFALHGDNTIAVAAVVFFIDFNQNTLEWCSAGVPSFFIRRHKQKEFEPIEMRNYLIGYEPGVKFLAKSMSLEGIDEIIFSSDGFSELLFRLPEEMVKAKHDDVSAILIQLKRNCKICENHNKNESLFLL